MTSFPFLKLYKLFTLVLLLFCADFLTYVFTWISKFLNFSMNYSF